MKELFNDTSKVCNDLLQKHGTSDPESWIRVADALMFCANKFAKAGYEKLGTEGEIGNG